MMRPTMPVTGAWPRTVLWVTLTAGLAWVAWPIWGSATVADSAAQSDEAPWVLAALCALLLLLGFTLWHNAGRTLRPFAPAALLVAAATLTRAVLHPGSSGIEFGYAFPLLAGILMGSPAGFLTGAAAALVSSLVTDTITVHLVAQTLVWGLWGLAGGVLRPLGTTSAWLLGALLCLPLGPVSGLLLNLTTWPADQSDNATFLPGLGAWESAIRLARYCWETSFGYDLMRGIASAVLLLLIGRPLLTALRHSHDTRTLPVEPLDGPPPAVSPHAVQRRAKNAALTTLWTPDTDTSRGDPDD